jgi:hypothetical protein
VITQRNRRMTPGTKPVMTPPDAGSERPMEIFEARVEHPGGGARRLSARHLSPVGPARRMARRVRQADRAPQIARVLSQDARKRGV